MSQLREQLSACFPARSAYLATLPKAPAFAADESAIARLGTALPTPAPLLNAVAPEAHAIGGRTRTVLHATAQLGAVGDTRPTSELLEQAICKIEQGLAQTFPILKDSFLDGFVLDVDYPGFRARAERHVPSEAWAIRIDHVLAELPGAVMRLQAGVATRFDRDGTPTGVHFATRLAIGGYSSAAGRSAVPNFVGALTDQLGLVCAGRKLTGAPWYVRAEDADEFIRFLEHPARHVAVLAVGRQPSGWRLDPEALAAETQGCAVIAMLSDEVIHRVIEVLGKEHAVLAGAARMYAAGYHRSHPPYKHPLYMRASLRHQFLREQDTHAMLWQAVLDHSSLSDYARPFVPFVDILAERNREDSLRAAAIVPVMPVPEPQAAVPVLEDTVRELRDSLKQAKEQVREIQAERSSVEAYLLARLKRREALPVSIPLDLDSLPDWTEKTLSGKLVLTPRARASVERSRFEDSDLIYEALCLLAFEYRDMCLGGARAPFVARLEALGLDESRSVSEYGATSEYFIDYRGTRTFLERHLKRGIARDERLCLRIYFFYDKREQVVVVGHLPDHLTTRQT